MFNTKVHLHQEQTPPSYTKQTETDNMTTPELIKPVPGAQAYITNIEICHHER